MGARDVLKGERTEEQHYSTFMGLWGMQDANQQVTFDMFQGYFDNVSSAYGDDEEFCAMMQH